MSDDAGHRGGPGGDAPGQEAIEQVTLEERAKIDATLLADFNTCVAQSDQMLQKSGVPLQRARDIAYARSLLLLPEWNVVACALKGAGEHEIKQLAMIEVKGPDGTPCPSLAVFPTATIARAESTRMKVPIEGAVWVTLSAPVGGVFDWLKSIKVPAVSVVATMNGSGPNCVLGLDFIEWVRQVEAQQRPPEQQG